ncbi:hypothetical protein EX30DRAFT_393287 [Ascodesmis nigricans]|uniref:Uncharacterized protein n=1 Tax=Ascodesmis nigricans TaxID=341454 RepID=A0A4S2N3F7_9PEZI|nr:hypothetical protein EX30DRAFT_393287 [Ascodesmis nigricans]
MVWLPSEADCMKNDPMATQKCPASFNWWRHFHQILHTEYGEAYVLACTSFGDRPLEDKYHGARERARYVPLNITGKGRPHPDTGVFLSATRAGSVMPNANTCVCLTSLTRLPLALLEPTPLGSVQLPLASSTTLQKLLVNFGEDPANAGSLGDSTFYAAFPELLRKWTEPV